MRMKKWMALLPLLAGLAACEDFGSLGEPKGKGELRWVLEKSLLTKADEELPDTNDFILTVRDAAGSILYEGSYGDSPESLLVDPGSYTVSVVSLLFTAPAFSRPQYGDEQVVVVQSGQQATARLQCTLLNAGIRLKTASDFLTAFPDGTLYVQQDGHKLKYVYKETRIAYFSPGPVSVLLYNLGQEQTLFTRSLQAREILTVSISAPQAATAASDIQVAVDTVKNWHSESFVIGGDNGESNSGEAPEDAFSVGEVAAHVGEKGVWVYGYIVGGDLSTAGTTVKTSGITKSTHLALADRSSTTVKSQCLAVELPKGAVRDALNLVDHPGLIGTRVYVKGTLVDAYFGTKGMKGTSDYARK